jgi:hypothetical protein
MADDGKLEVHGSDDEQDRWMSTTHAPEVDARKASG